MQEEILAYIEYLHNFNEVIKPKMPKFNLLAYTDNEYVKAIYLLNAEFDLIDDIQLTLNRLKEE